MLLTPDDVPPVVPAARFFGTHGFVHRSILLIRQITRWVWSTST